MSWTNPVNTNDDYIQPPEKKGEDVKEVYGADAVHFKEETENQNQKRKQQKYPEKQEAKDHFEELTKAVAAAHVTLVENNSPYRFCVYRENDEIFIDIVHLSKQGKADTIIKKISRMKNSTRSCRK